MKNSVNLLVCEDIRYEEGGKRSYVGVYGDTLILDFFPSVLRLCFVVKLRSTDTKIKKLYVRIKLNDIVLFDQTHDFSHLPKPKRLTSTDRYIFEMLGVQLTATEFGKLSVGVSTDNKTFAEDEIVIVKGSSEPPT